MQAYTMLAAITVYTHSAFAAAGALAVIDVHARDVVEKMAAAGVSTASDFDWYSQMRFYWKKPAAGIAATTALNRSAGKAITSISTE
jgi:hypothetical protein